MDYFEALSSLDAYNNNNKEKSIQKKIHKQLGGEIEAGTPIGDIDLLTDDKLIEIKSYDDWKCGLGQIIAYSTFYPDREKHLYLFDVGDNKITIVKKICKNNDIRLTVYD
jgi:hypothetical protein